MCAPHMQPNVYYYLVVALDNLCTAVTHRILIVFECDAPNGGGGDKQQRLRYIQNL